MRLLEIGFWLNTRKLFKKIIINLREREGGQVCVSIVCEKNNKKKKLGRCIFDKS